MASEIKSDKLSPSTGTSLQIGDASDTITIPTGATFTITDGLGVAGGGTGLTSFTAGDVLYATGTTTLAKLAKGTAEQVSAMNSGATAPDWGSVDLTVLPTITVAKGGTNLSSFTAGDILYATGSTTLAKLAKGSDDDVLTLASGVPSWAATSGGISWQSVVTGSTLTAVAGNGYPIDTSSNACTVTLPASASVGDQIIFTDYARRWSVNALTINQNSLNYQGLTTPNPVYDTQGESIHIVYMDATKGWIPTNDGAVALETSSTYTLTDVLVVAGGGAGGHGGTGGGGGAGGFRQTSGTTLTTGTIYTISVGDGGTAATTGAVVPGDDSSITGSDITDFVSAGGGGGGMPAAQTGGDGGSGGGAAYGSYTGGASSPVTSPVQGYAGGNTSSASLPVGGGGGGASQAGTLGGGSAGGDGGNGTADSISGSSVTYAGGGGGGSETSSAPPGGSGGGGTGGCTVSVATAGTVNLGSGGGGGGYGPSDVAGANGGKGVVILRMADGDYSGGVSGSPTVATDVGGSGETTVTYTGDGSYIG